MTRHERKFRSNRLITLFVPLLACIIVSDTGCQRKTGEQNLDSPVPSSPESALHCLLLEGHELHTSLRISQLDSLQDLPTNAELPGNPHLSTENAFVDAIAHGGSQGRLGPEGIRSALYAHYTTGENEVGMYGLEAKSFADADRREKEVREIWAYGASLDRAHVQRKDLVIIVIWNDGVSPECWESVKAKLEQRLNASGSL